MSRTLSVSRTGRWPSSYHDAGLGEIKEALMSVWTQTLCPSQLLRRKESQSCWGRWTPGLQTDFHKARVRRLREGLPHRGHRLTRWRPDSSGGCARTVRWSHRLPEFSWAAGSWPSILRSEYSKLWSCCLLQSSHSRLHRCLGLARPVGLLIIWQFVLWNSGCWKRRWFQRKLELWKRRPFLPNKKRQSTDL